VRAEISPGASVPHHHITPNRWLHTAFEAVAIVVNIIIDGSSDMPNCNSSDIRNKWKSVRMAAAASI